MTNRENCKDGKKRLESEREYAVGIAAMTQRQIWDSLHGKEITKAALRAHLMLAKDFPLGQWGKLQRERADKITARFRIHDLILRWKQAPIN